ncbi:hypothetical protein Rcae01_00645 [Novipirellula caenicola]|uniref:Uncharacterized protein n=1 Tax=Novipirellula caenicola TaxID=1536901 RepID=A0ABP9VJ17_9BACT
MFIRCHTDRQPRGQVRNSRPRIAVHRRLFLRDRLRISRSIFHGRETDHGDLLAIKRRLGTEDMVVMLSKSMRLVADVLQQSQCKRTFA